MRRHLFSFDQMRLLFISLYIASTREAARGRGAVARALRHGRRPRVHTPTKRCAGPTSTVLSRASPSNGTGAVLEAFGGDCSQNTGGGQGCIRRERTSEAALDRRLEEVAKAVGSGYCRLQMPSTPALGVRGTVAGHRLGALAGGGGTSPHFQCIPGSGGDFFF
jgi:hypothetical protein